MYLDALTLAALRDELAERLVGGRVQRIVRPSNLSLGLEIYARERHQLLLSAEPQTAGILLSDAKLRRGTETPSPLELLLRKYVRGARLYAVEQPPLERVLRLGFERPEGPVALVCEMMGRLSNLILVSADDTVMEAAKRVPASVNRYRTVLPQTPYVPPPPQVKEHPLLWTPHLLRQAIAGDDETPLWRRLVAVTAGVSPLVAKEVVFRATGEAMPAGPLPDEAYASLVSVLGDLYHLPGTHAWSPCVAYEGQDAARRPVAYAPYDLTLYPDRAPVARISEAIGPLDQARATFDAYAQVRARLVERVEEQINRQRARLASLRASMASAAEIEDLQARGNAILAMAWSTQPGQEALGVEPAPFGIAQPAGDDGLVHIPLDPTLSAAENAQALFRDYRKLKAAAQQVPGLMAESERELAYLAQLRADIALAEDRPGLDDIEAQMRAAGYLGKSGPKRGATRAAPSEPLRLRSADGALILVGRNSRQNDEVTFRMGDANDLWLHAHGVPGAHVIVKRGGAEVSPETLRQAARLAARYSAARDQARVQVDYAERRYVRHIKGGRPGMVTYTHEQTLTIDPDYET